CYNEPFMDEFVEYYLSEGVDKIYILYDTKSTLPISQSVRDNSKVFVVQSSTNFAKGPDYGKDFHNLYNQIRYLSTWFIYVDCDEYINTRRNTNKTIRDELLTTFKFADCITIPWVMMSCNQRENDPKSVLQELTTRWDHNNPHPHPNNWYKGRCRYNGIEAKCIFKGKVFDKITDHYPKSSTNNRLIRRVDGIQNKPIKLLGYYKNLREHHIKNAFLIVMVTSNQIG
ncbi:MAG: glycosyltransferase family 2 protein, partial [Gammaproteobacteria bacterium]